MSAIRPAAVAGMFYPDDPRELRPLLRALLSEATPGPPGPAPKAIIVPHAGYVYSGPIAATAYARLRAAAGRIRRVVLIGPAHRVALRGLAISGAGAFETPLGAVPVDLPAVEALLALPFVQRVDAAHAAEHSLEVHLPFLQTVLGDFMLVPLVAGEAASAEVATVLEQLWGGEETLIVVSSDLSHYLPYDEARAIDRRTCEAIERFDPTALDWEQACGRVPVGGLLLAAKRHGLKVTTLDLRNSGDTAGDRRRVVGYGAWAFTAEAAPVDAGGR